MGKSFEIIAQDGYNPSEKHDLYLEGGVGYKSASVKKVNKFARELGPQIGLITTDDIYDLRRELQARKEIPDLETITLTIEIVNEIRERYGFEPISQEEYDAITTSSQEVVGEEGEAQEAYNKNPEEGIPVDDTEQGVIAEDATTDLGGNISPEKSLDNAVSDKTSDQIEAVSQESSSLEAEQVSEPSVDVETEESTTLDLETSPEQLDDSTAEEVDETSSPEVSVSDEALKAALAVAEANVQEEVRQSQGPEGLPSDNESSLEKIERLNQAREAIRVYQEFGQQHPYHTRDKATQERYRQLEEEAWEALNKLAHSEGGDIITLPQQRDIALSHPESVDTRQYLETIGYQFDEDGNIITVADKGKLIVLNRHYPIEDIINSPRPAHIVYDRNVNLDEVKTLTYYHGHLVRGLNPNTPDFIKGVLDKEFLESNIVSSEDQPVSTTEELGSTPETDIDMSAYENLNLSDEQLTRIRATIEWGKRENIQGLTPERIVQYTEQSFNEDQARQIFLGFHQELTDEEVAQYAKSDISVDEMKAKRNELVEAKKIPSEESEPEVNSISKEEQTSVAAEGGTPSDKGESIPQNKIDMLRVAYARAEEFYNRNRRDKEAKAELERIREEYNQTIERVFGIMVAEGLEQNIHKIFAQEVYNLREARIAQSKELQTGFERAMNPIKEKLLNFAIKNKKVWAGINIGLAVGGGLFALSGAGLPVAGALEGVRRFVASAMTGVSAREGMRALLEDADVKLGKLKWQSVIPKLVSESLKDGYVDAATDTDLSAKLSTLEAYYRLNGGTFTNDSQQKAYETILRKLGERIQSKTIENNQPKENNDSKLMQGEEGKETSSSIDSEVNSTVSTPEQNNARYTSELLKIMSEKRINELQKQQKKRLIANLVGTAVGGSLMSSLAADMMRPGGALNPDQVSATSTPEVEPISPNPGEVGVTTETAKEMAQSLSPEQLQDISELDSGETLWSEMAKRFGENATDAQIQQGVEAYMNTSQGQESIYNLARQTEGGKALLSQWGIDNAAELSQLPKTDLFELSRHLGVGELRGLDTLDITNLPPLDEIAIPTEFNPTESPSSGVTPPGPGAESVSQVDKNVFMSQVAETLGIDKVNLTETEFTNIMYSYLETEQGRDALYNLALSDESGKTLLEQFGVYSIEDFNRLSPTELYNLSQSVDLNNLEGFNFNDIMLSKFENAPDSITLMKGTGPLTQVNQYIDMYAGGLPYDSTLGQEVLTNYLQTPEGKDWLYDAIVNNPDSLNGNQNIQLAKELLRFRGIQSGADIDWTTLSQDKRFPTSIFWRETVLPDGKRLPPLSTLLKPGEIPGIKEVLKSVLTKQ